MKIDYEKRKINLFQLLRLIQSSDFPINKSFSDYMIDNDFDKECSKYIEKLFLDISTNTFYIERKTPGVFDAEYILGETMFFYAVYYFMIDKIKLKNLLILTEYEGFKYSNFENDMRYYFENIEIEIRVLNKNNKFIDQLDKMLS